MRSYSDFKKIFIEFKPKLRLGLYACLIFMLGFGTGRGAKQLQPDYGTKNEKKPAETTPANAATKTIPKPVVDKKPVDLKNCPIKGNISSKDKVYHLKGGAFYDRTTPEQCFNTEAEAKAAGFRKSSR